MKKLATTLGIAHRTLRWTRAKPTTGLQQAARTARYRIAGASRARGRRSTHILTAHTLDDQAETVLIRMSRGSGLAGSRPWRGCRACRMGRAHDRPGAPVARHPQGAARRHIARRKDYFRRRSFEPRPALHPRAAARADAGACRARGSTPPGWRCLRAGSSGRMRRSRPQSTAPRPCSAPVPKNRPHRIPAPRFARLPAEIALRLLGRAVAQRRRRRPGRTCQAGSAQCGAATTRNWPASRRFRRTSCRRDCDTRRGGN